MTDLKEQLQAVRTVASARHAGTGCQLPVKFNRKPFACGFRMTDLKKQLQALSSKLQGKAPEGFSENALQRHG